MACSSKARPAYIGRDEAGPVATLADYSNLTRRDADAGARSLKRAVVLKLNGGLGTGMGMDGPKSLLVVKDGLTFLDIIVNQIVHLRQTTGARLPLVLMDSYNTKEESLAALAGHTDFHQDLPLDFLQHKQPKIWKETLAPVEWPADPEKEWCPPGHGDIYSALVTSGTLEKLLSAGYEYAFVSNSDNLGVELDLQILGYVAVYQVPFLMEVADRTASDRKGGHLAQRPDGQFDPAFVCSVSTRRGSRVPGYPPLPLFQHQQLVDQPACPLATVLGRHNGVMALPLIRNEKPVDPTEPSTPRAYQLETAMGLAIAVFAAAHRPCASRAAGLYP